MPNGREQSICSRWDQRDLSKPRAAGNLPELSKGMGVGAPSSLRTFFRVPGSIC